MRKEQSQEFPQTVFLIVGDDLEYGGILFERLKQEATQSKVSENIIFKGWRKAMKIF